MRPQTQFVFPKPGPALKGVMIAIFAIWLMFALALNWGGASEQVFLLFCGNTDAILQGQIWRLFTAPLLQMPNSVFSMLFTLLGLYFLGATLEETWGSKRFLRFLLVSALFAYSVQMLADLVLPASISAKLIGEYWFGAFPVIDAIAIAFALMFAGRTVHLMFVLPVSSRGLILFVVAMNVLYLIAAERGPSGFIAPFGGMIAGWLFGGGTPSPLRRAYLKWRLAQLDREAKLSKTARKKRVARSGLKVVEGGKGGPDDDDRGRGPDGRLLN